MTAVPRTAEAWWDPWTGCVISPAAYNLCPDWSSVVCVQLFDGLAADGRTVTSTLPNCGHHTPALLYPYS